MPLGRRLIAVLVVVVAALPALPALPAAASVPVVIIDGRGFGHGVGMAQDGALEMGRRGFSLGQILGQFYPGVSIGRGTGDVRVPVQDAGGAPTAAGVAFPDGGMVVDALSGPQSLGFPMNVPAGGSA